jgi:hypothetical protein
MDTDMLLEFQRLFDLQEFLTLTFIEILNLTQVQIGCVAERAKAEGKEGWTLCGEN